MGPQDEERNGRSYAEERNGQALKVKALKTHGASGAKRADLRSTRWRPRSTAIIRWAPTEPGDEIDWDSEVKH